jgi:hypothetical protein
MKMSEIADLISRGIISNSPPYAADDIYHRGVLSGYQAVAYDIAIANFSRTSPASLAAYEKFLEACGCPR